MIDHRTYVPILKWRQGEYQALLKLSDALKDGILPLIEIPPIGWDFEERKQAKTIDQHLSKFGRRLSQKWGGQPAFVDVPWADTNTQMVDRSHPLVFVFNDARRENAFAIPVTGIRRDSDYQSAVAEIVEADHRGVCLRIDVDDWSPSNMGAITNLLDRLDLDATDADLLLDLGAPNFLPLDGFGKLLAVIYPPLANAASWRSVIVAGTAFPKSMADLTAPTQLVPRYEWQAYKAFVGAAKAGDRTPSFGDYAIAHPILPQEDMRLLRPSASIRYTVDDAWHVTKGKNVRDNGFEQYVTHCLDLVGSSHFLGPSFSEADNYIYKCSKAEVGTGNLTTWRWVGTNHHLTKVARDLSSFFGP